MKLSRFLIIALMAAGAALPSRAAQAKVTATIDSTVVEMGSLAHITVNVVDPSHSGTLVNLPKPTTDGEDFDVIDVKCDTTTGGYQYLITIQAYYPKMAAFEPFLYAIGSDTARSEVLALKVLPVSLDSMPVGEDSLPTINPMQSVVNPPRRWYDFIPDEAWWGLIALAICVAVACGIYMYRMYRKTGSILLRKPKPVDPYKLAMSQLNALRDRRLAEAGKEREYYTTLVDILRTYLQGRFQINAMEMSSTQILESLRNNPDTRDNRERISQILEIADFVKFAKVRPLPDDNIKAFNNTLYFVESTKPLPEPDDNGKGKGKAKGKGKGKRKAITKAKGKDKTTKKK